MRRLERFVVVVWGLQVSIVGCFVHTGTSRYHPASFGGVSSKPTGNTQTVTIRNSRSRLASTSDPDEIQSTNATSTAAVPQSPSEPDLSNPSGTPTMSFNLTTALFCAGLAFDTYTEPPQNSSRWEKGSQGMKVAFLSPAFTRSLYKGLLEVTPISCSDLPDEESTAEGLLSGGGIDAAVWVAVVESQYTEDVKLLQKEEFHNGVFDISNAAHVGKSRTAWSNTDERKSRVAMKQRGVAVPYHVKSTWGTGGRANFTSDEPPFYLYVQEPSSARLVFTLVDDNVVDQPLPISSAHRRLSELVPLASVRNDDLVRELKNLVQEQLDAGRERGDISLPELDDVLPDLLQKSQGWDGSIKFTNKPRKRSKTSQVALGAAAGAAVAGPVGAAVGGAFASLYEGQVRGRVDVRLRYLPIPSVDVPRSTYRAKGGLPGVDWGDMYDQFLAKQAGGLHSDSAMGKSQYSDGELCFVIDHETTGGNCAVYRSLEKRLIVVSFRGTCKPKDIFTDAAIAQDAWVEGEDVKEEGTLKVHSGFRRSMNSISRRLKELVLAAVAPGEDISDYDMLVTGHSLGGALATLFVMDIGEYGIDAGRSLPQTKESDAWWTAIANTFMGKDAIGHERARTPPRPKSLCMYNFGSPRVGNSEFASKFDSLVQDGKIDEAYRVVNGEDLVARHPRTINALVFGNVAYEHCGATALVSVSREQGEDDTGEPLVYPRVWVEGESDDNECPVRDGTPLTSPLADGSLLADLFNSTQEAWKANGTETQTMQLAALAGKIQQTASKFSQRLKTVSATDVASIIGVDKRFTNREMRMIDSILKGEALSHHMEDQYYSALGRACGFVATVGENLSELIESTPLPDRNNTMTASSQR